MKARNYTEQPAPTMIREHFSKSLKEVHGGLRAWVLERPAWLQPPLMGALLVYGFVLWRGGLIVLPVAALTFVFGSPRDRAFFGPLLLAVLVYAPAAGFVGGLIYAFAKPISNRLRGVRGELKIIFGALDLCSWLCLSTRLQLDLSADLSTRSRSRSQIGSAGSGNT